MRRCVDPEERGARARRTGDPGPGVMPRGPEQPVRLGTRGAAPPQAPLPASVPTSTRRFGRCRQELEQTRRWQYWGQRALRSRSKRRAAEAGRGNGHLVGADAGKSVAHSTSMGAGSGRGCRAVRSPEAWSAASVSRHVGDGWEKSMRSWHGPWVRAERSLHEKAMQPAHIAFFPSSARNPRLAYAVRGLAAAVGLLGYSSQLGVFSSTDSPGKEGSNYGATTRSLPHGQKKLRRTRRVDGRGGSGNPTSCSPVRNRSSLISTRCLRSEGYERQDPTSSHF